MLKLVEAMRGLNWCALLMRHRLLNINYEACASIGVI
jgi:hypothetical protein